MWILKHNIKQMRLISIFHKGMPLDQERFGLMSDTEFMFQKLHVFIYKK